MKSKLTPEELGSVEVVLLGFNRHQLPRLLDIKSRVDSGDLLNEFELVFLESALQEVRDSQHFADYHPEYKLLISEVANLYKHITQKAIENQSAKATN